MIDQGVSQFLRTITKISTQKKSANRYNIFLDHEYAFSVDEDVLIKFHLHKGLTLSDEMIKNITENESLQRSYLLAINYVSYRMRSMLEMRTYLKGKEMEETAIDQVIDRLVLEKVLNDEEFANAYVKDRMNFTSKGPTLIAKELQEKGVSFEIANRAALQYSEEQQFAKAIKWVEREFNKKSKHSYRKRQEQLTYKLLQKGFTNDVVTDVMREVSREKDHEEEKSVLQVQGDKLVRRYSKKFSGYELKTKIKAGLYSRGFSSELINEYVENLEE